MSILATHDRESNLHAASPDVATEVQAGSPHLGVNVDSRCGRYDRFPDLKPGVGGSGTKNGNTVSHMATLYEDRSLTETLQTGDA